MNKVIILFITTLVLISCERNAEYKAIKKSKSATAVLNYQINSNDPVSDIKSFKVKELINFLIASSGLDPDETNKITLQSISIEVKVNTDNTASELEFLTEVEKINCNGSSSVLTPFSIMNKLPLQIFGFNVPVAVNVSLNPEGVGLLNNILAEDLPYNAFNGFGANSCQGVNFLLVGSVSPSSAQASLSLNVIINYNIEYVICEKMDAVDAWLAIDEECQ